MALPGPLVRREKRLELEFASNAEHQAWVFTKRYRTYRALLSQVPWS